jgi:hypothetical protein
LHDKNTFYAAGFWINPHLEHSASTDSGSPRLDGILNPPYRDRETFYLALSERFAMNSSAGAGLCRADVSRP